MEVIVGLAGVLGFGALAVWYFQETLKQLLPTPRRIARQWRIWRGEVPRAKGTHFTVLIADLDGDAEGSQTRHVEAALREHRGLEVLLVGPGPSSFDLGSRAEAEFEAEKRGRDILEKYNGDVLIFGEVTQANTRLWLRFLPGHSRVESRHDSYQLQEAKLPARFGADFNTVLLALVAASVDPATERQGHYLVDLLSPAVGKLKHLCHPMPAGLDHGERGSLWHAFGLAAGVLGEQKGESDWLEEAVEAYRAALEEWTRERAPLQWAAIQNNLGNALRALGERDSGTARLEEAVVAYRAALLEYDRECEPLDWARTQNNLGIALAVLGERESGTARLEEAVTAYRDALQGITRGRAPDDWAVTQDNLDGALATLGRREQEGAAGGSGHDRQECSRNL